MKKTCLLISLSLCLFLSACGKRTQNIPSLDENISPEDLSVQTELPEISQSETLQKETRETEETTEPEKPISSELTDSEESFDDDSDNSQSEEGNAAFKLTEQGKDFLSNMCFIIDDFSSTDDMDEDFWETFIFLSCVSCYRFDINHEDTKIYLEDYEQDEYMIKVSLEEIESHTRLTFGIELPDIKPSLEDNKEGYSPRFYQDGYYYIGGFDFMDIDYIFNDCTVYEEELGTYAIVTYILQDNSLPSASWDGSIITYTLSPADNENGFIILSKTTEWASE